MHFYPKQKQKKRPFPIVNLVTMICSWPISRFYFLRMHQSYQSGTYENVIELEMSS